MYYRGQGNPGVVVPGLGIDPITVITTGQIAVKTLNQYKHPKDPARFEANAEAANAALAGDAGALAFLHQRTGQYAPAVVDFSPMAYPHDISQPIGGWATEDPKRDAAEKEAQVRSRTGVRGVVAGVGDSWVMWAVGAGLAFALLRRRGSR